MRMVFCSTLVLLLLSVGAMVVAKETQNTLFEFTGSDAAKEWQTVNDGVMGGVSEGEFKITEAKTLEFFGNLSLKCP
ncbi:MAG: CIA30 family protein [Gammaproteobacteria bacterium]